jgi:TldD protein
VLKEISMVGRDLALSAGMCGSVSGSIPASVGQPPLKVDNILVGGNA